MPAPSATIPAVPHQAHSPTLGEDLLVLRDVGVSFGGLRALDGVDLSVPEGGLYGMIGPNGPMAGTMTLSDGIDKLGLKLEPVEVPLPV